MAHCATGCWSRSGSTRLERLVEAGAEAEVRRLHAAFYLALAERAEPELLGADQAEWLERLRTEIGNLRGAISWSLEPGGGEDERAGLGLRLVAASWRFWDVEGFREGKRWLRAALERDPGGFPAVRARALVGLGWILNFQGDYGPAVAALEEAVALYGELGEESDAALALSNLGSAVMRGGFEERLRAFVEEGEALMRGDLEGHARADLRMLLACAATAEGDHDSAVSQLEESLALCRELGDHWNTAFSLYILGMIELQRGDLERGEALIEECVPIGRELEYSFRWPTSLGLGMVAALRGRPVRAARLWGAAEALRERLGLALSHFELVPSGYERDLAAVRSALSESTFDAAWAEGRAMSPEQAFEYALGEPATPHEEDKDILPPAVRSDLHCDIFALGSARVEKEGSPSTLPTGPEAPRAALFPALAPGGTHQGADRSRPLARGFHRPAQEQLPRHPLPPEAGSWGQGVGLLREGTLLLRALALLLLRRRGLRGEPLRGPQAQRRIRPRGPSGICRRQPTLRGRLPRRPGGRWRVGVRPPGGAEARLRGGAAAPGSSSPRAPRRGLGGLQEGHLPRPLSGGGAQGFDASQAASGERGRAEALRGAGRAARG